MDMNPPESIKNTEFLVSYENFFKYFELIEEMKQSSKFFRIDNLEREILEVISVNWNKKNLLLVSDVISLSKIGSPATLHARLKNLRDKGFVEYVLDNDARKKFVQPTEQALNYFGDLVRCMSAAINH
ncbi:MAG: hypothetical protein WCK52_11945 [Betaproteobacteria bacterium]